MLTVSWARAAPAANKKSSNTTAGMPSVKRDIGANLHFLVKVANKCRACFDSSIGRGLRSHFMGEKDCNSTELIRDPDASIRRDLDSLALLVVDGPDAGHLCRLGSETICVGSDPEAQLVLVDGTVSRRHILARQTEAGAWIQDQDSTNGTFFGGSRVKELVLGPGATIRVGQTLLKVVPHQECLRPQPSTENNFHGVLGSSLRMREIFATLKDVATTDLTIMIEGETGTGKEVLAEAIHTESRRSAAPFVVVDCTTIAANLAESELFGHRKGAFTGATSDRNGSFEQARGGTIFIDEVGDMPAELQPKLLRAIERREFKPLGSDKTSQVDVRVIAATNRNLEEEIARGAFREDLFYRLAVITVRLPQLRERGQDLALLAGHFLSSASGGDVAPVIPAESMLRFADYAWPGNVRQLRNVVERAFALHRAEPFDMEVFIAELARGIGESNARLSGGHEPFKQAKSRVVDSFEQAYLSDLIQRHGGNVSRAAREARLDRHHLRDLLTKHGIEVK